MSWGEFVFAAATPVLAILMSIFSSIAGMNTRKNIMDIIINDKSGAKNSTDNDLTHKLNAEVSGSVIFVTFVCTIFSFSIGCCSIFLTRQLPGWSYAIFCLIGMALMTLFLYTIKEIGLRELDDYYFKNPLHVIFGRRTFGFTYFKFFDRLCYILNISVIIVIIFCKFGSEPHPPPAPKACRPQTGASAVTQPTKSTR